MLESAGDTIMLPEPGMSPMDLADTSMAGSMDLGMGMGMGMGGWNQEVSLIDDITSQPRRSPQKRLEQMIEFDEEQAAAVLKQWVHKRDAA